MKRTLVSFTARGAFAAALCGLVAPAYAAKSIKVTMNLITVDGVGKSVGTITIKEGKDGVTIEPKLKDLPPGEHGFHVHEKGDCSSGDGMSAGGHFNPDAKPHGAPNKPHHDGDLWALKADANGAAKATFTVEGVTVSAGTHSVVGRGLIVHKDPDDYTTQPTGNSGARIACAVIAAGN